MGLVNGWQYPKTLPKKRKLEIDFEEEKIKASYWKVSQKDKKESSQRLNSLKTPSGWSRATSRMWTQCGTLNAGDFIDFVEKDLIFAMKNFLPDAQFEATCKLVRVFRLLLRFEIRRDELQALRNAIRDALVTWDAVAPYWAKPKILHLLIHLVDDIENFGNVSNFWMFPYERFIG